jgi:hypothetical protein
MRGPIYLISPEKRVRHAAVAYMLEAARANWGASHENRMGKERGDGSRRDLHA